MNDNDRAQWVDNDESLYLSWRRSRQSMRAFVRANRAELDALIDRVINAEPAPDHLHSADGCYWCTRRTEDYGR